MMKNFARHPRHISPPQRQAGLSLVELMISLTIGLVLLAGMTTLIVQQSGARREMEKSGRQIENGRYAMEILHGDIEHAGFYGEYAVPASATYSEPGPCNAGMNAANHGWNSTTSPVAMPLPVYGTPGNFATPSGCNITDRKAGTAMLTVRRADTAAVPTTATKANTAYFQTSRCNSDTEPFMLALGAWALREKDCVSLVPVHRYVVRTYYIGTCSVCGTDTIPTLKMVEFDGTLSAPTPVVEGIENMQFEYGIDNSGDGTPDEYIAAPATTAQWANVVAVRVYLLARNNEITAGYTDTKTYDLGPAVLPVGPMGDAYKRHAYSQLVRATNLSGRRE